MSEHIARDAIARMHRAPVFHDEAHAEILVANLHTLAGANAERERVAWEQRKVELVAAYCLPTVAQSKPFAFSEGKAIVPVHGTLINRFSASWGFVTGYNFIRSQVMAAAADPDVDSIILDVNSFGGMCAGCMETADTIYAAREAKPVFAVVDAYAYSAGYAIASAATKVAVTPTGGAGSIGVVAAHMSMEGMLDKFGIKVTFIHAGARKVDGNPYQNLSDEARAGIQREVDALYGQFVAQVSRNRGLDADKVRATEAATFTAEEAVALGLADVASPPAGALAGFFNHDDTEEGSMAQTQAQAPAPEANAPAQPNADEAKKAERARIAAITGHENAKGRGKLASHLAFNTEMSVDEAAAILAAAEPEKAPEATAPQAPVGEGAFHDAMSKTDHPNVGAGPEAAAPDAKGGDRVTEALAAYRAATGAKFVTDTKH